MLIMKTVDNFVLPQWYTRHRHLQNVSYCFPQEGMPSDEQGKSMLYAALKLRLSLVGSMLGSICASESTTLEWVPLLMQLLCSGAVDRQTDSRLDMTCIFVLTYMHTHTYMRSLPMHTFCLSLTYT